MEDIKIDIARYDPVSGLDVYNAAVAAQDQQETTYITADGQRIAAIVPLSLPPEPGEAYVLADVVADRLPAELDADRTAAWAPDKGYANWTDGSALGQAQNGEPNTPQWTAAWDYIESRLQGCDPGLANARIDDPYGPEPGDGDPGFNYYDDDEPDEPAPDDYDPGPEIDDEGGASEYRHPDAYPEGEPWGPGNPAPGSLWDTRRSEQEK
jgi:hypothetical protein